MFLLLNCCNVWLFVSFCVSDSDDNMFLLPICYDLLLFISLFIGFCVSDSDSNTVSIR